MPDQPVHLAGLPAGLSQRGRGRLRHALHRVGEDLLAAHREVVVGRVARRRLLGAAGPDGDDVGQGAVAAELHPADRAGLGGVPGAQDHRAGPVAEQDTGGPVGRVDDGAERLGPDHQGLLGGPGGDQARRHGQRVQEPGAHGRHVEGRQAGEAQPVRDQRRGGRAGPVGSGGSQHHHVHVLDPGAVHGPRASFGGQVGGGQAGIHDVPGADPGPGPDPLVGGVHPGGELVVGHDPRGQPGPQAADDRRPRTGRINRSHATEPAGRRWNHTRPFLGARAARAGRRRPRGGRLRRRGPGRRAEQRQDPAAARADVAVAPGQGGQPLPRAALDQLVRPGGQQRFQGSQ